MAKNTTPNGTTKAEALLAKLDSYDFKSLFGNPKIVSAFIVLVVIVAGYSFIHQSHISRDKTNLHFANAHLEAAGTEISKQVSVKLGIKTERECSVDNIGFGQHGQLDCSISVNGTYPAKNYADAQTFQKKLEAIIITKAVFGFAAPSTTTPQTYVDEGRNLTCSWTASVPAASQTGTAATQPISLPFILTCVLQGATRNYY